jgi:peptide/nickel transport system permease protein
MTDASRAISQQIVFTEAPLDDVRRRGLSALWSRYSRNRLAVVGAILIALQLLVALLGPLLLGRDPILQQAQPLMPASPRYPFGTDDLGRDILARIVSGAGLTLFEGVAAAAITTIVGTPIGAIAAYNRRLENLIMRPTEVLLAIPGLLLALALVPIVGASLIGSVMAASLSMIPNTIVFTRSIVLGVIPNDYVLAARAIGCRDGRIIFRHVIPNTSSVLTVSTTIRVAIGILIVSGLSFIGLGAQPPTPEWGAMLANGKDFLYSAPHVAMFPALALAITIFSFNMLGDGLRDALDPRTARRR